MSKLLALFLTMLRYRVAMMIWMFMLLGSAFQDGLLKLGWGHAWASIALGSCYVAATTVNDIADKSIDLINHPGDEGRPLVTGEATERDLYLVHTSAAALAIAAAALIGWTAVGIVIASLLIGHAYSLGPVRLSYRTYLAPAALAFAYVLLPYQLGVATSGSAFGSDDALFSGGLISLFLARINLKDFRDRDGDALYGKPTLLLRVGKQTTCLVSLVALVASNLLLLAAFEPPWFIALSMQCFVAAIGYMLLMLWRADEGRSEQIAIGTGARMGNGFLILVLGLLVLEARGASTQEEILFAFSLTLLFALGFLALTSRPDQVVIGYKG
jgi:4-hydroxybenzoate polyprenyltransferase